MSVSIGMITVDTTDAASLAQWWAEQTGGEVVEENDGWFVVVQLPQDGPRLAFQRVEDPTPGKNRIHLDVVTDDLDAEVTRLLAAGASHVADQEMPGFRWIVLADPDGNQFCVAPAH